MNWSADNRGEVFAIGPMHECKLMQMTVTHEGTLGNKTKFMFVAP